jgi:hypothetical protein
MRPNYVNSARCLLIAIVLIAASGAVAQPGAADLKLPVPRTFDLSHVEAKHYAVALGNDPARIFEFVRDQIGYEVYTGALRGPRGTLLAMAGNSVDKAAVLATLLQQSGQRARYARGSLADVRARLLVESLWVARPSTAPSESATSPSLKAAADAMLDGLQKDFAIVRDQVRAAGVGPGRGVTDTETLVKEASRHYWVQWWSEGHWVDLDPSFRDAVVGRAYAPADEMTDALPDSVYHRVELRVQLEEQDGDHSSRRVILRHNARAADLSGVDLVLIHRAEAWSGPLRSYQDALASGIASTGRVKPVLLTGPVAWTAGAPFFARPPQASGMEGMSAMLRGAGTRNTTPIATMEIVEIDFIDPQGQKETVVREIFDLAGPARRAASRPLTAEELNQRAGDRARDLATDVYSLLVLTGGVDAWHAGSTLPDSVPPEPRAALRRLGVAFAMVSDGLASRMERADGNVVRFYPDSPRLLVAELTQRAGKQRVALDLRRDRARAVAQRPDAASAHSAVLARGVVEGVIERALSEWMAVSFSAQPGVWTVGMSTSALFARARTAGVPILVLPRDKERLDASVPDDARARLQADVDRGYLAVVPQRPIPVDGAARIAWWQIDPRTGTTVAVTDDGLHQVSVEYHLVRDENGRVFIIVIDRANPDEILLLIRITSNSQLWTVIRVMMAAGIGRGMTFLN